MKAKYLILMLIGAILLYGTAVYGEEAFSPEKAYGSYYSYERLDPADNLDKGCYIVSNSNEINSKALFLKDMQMTGFKYNSIKKAGKKYAVVSRINDGVESFGLLNIESFEEILPTEYSAVEYGDSASPYEIDTSYYVVSKGIITRLCSRKEPLLRILNTTALLKTAILPL